MLPPDGHFVHEAETGLQWRSEDTPRKPEPGDRVRVSYEAEYHEHADDGHFVRPNDLDFPILTPSDVEITVIEPARPVVPETYYGVKIPEVVRDLWGTDCKEVRWWTAGVVAMQKINAMGEHIDAKFERGPVIGGE
jgi:hypothetical protein